MIGALILSFAYTANAGAATYYLAPDGSDTNSGTSAGTAWKTFNRAWQALQPGDTLLLLDGTYTGGTTGVIKPSVRNGEPGKPITIKALNDGKATIDGQGKEFPVRLGSDGPVGSYYALEGLVLRSSVGSVVHIKGSNNVLRRVSIYDADTNGNSLGLLLWGNNNLIEDVVVAGTGRYMIDVYGGGEGGGNGNVLRRVFTMWKGWDGRHFCGVTWPNGNHIGIYNASNNTVENAISYGRALTGIFIQANSDAAVANNNQILGSMALLQGRDYDGSVWTYGTGETQPTSRPGPTADESGGRACDDALTQWWWGNQRTGFSLWGQGQLRDNVYRDVLAVGNVGTGLSVAHPSGDGGVGTIIDHATLYDNGAQLQDWERALGGQILLDGSDVKVTNSRIANSEWASQGEGARFQYRYVNRQLTNEPLWPWPMEDRIKAELGVSVNEIAGKYASIDGFGVTVSPATTTVDRNGTLEITVKIDAFGKFAQPVSLHAADSTGGLRLEPADGTVTAPGQWKFKVTAPNESGIHELQIVAKADGETEVQRKVTIMVDLKRVFLPAVMSGKR
jgi:hypothetical protein